MAAAPNAVPAYRLPEALTLIVINLHGLVALGVHGAQPWQVLCVVAVAAVGVCRLVRPRLIPPQASFAAVLTLTWVLMASTGGTSSFFLAWLFMLALFYPLRLEGLLAALVAPVVGAVYLSLLVFPYSLPLAIIVSRALLLSVVGGCVYLLARQLRGSLQRERVGAAQRAQEKRRLQTLVETLPGITYETTPEGVRYISPQVEAVLGFAPDAFRRDSTLYTRLLHPDDRARVLAARRHCRTRGEPLQEEYRLLARDGHTVWVQDHAAAVTVDGKASGDLQGVMLDVTAQRAAQEQAEATLRFQAAVLDALQDPVIATDDAFRVRYWNLGAELTYGYSAEEALGKPVSELLRTRFSQADHDTALARLHAEGRWEGRVVQVTKRGALRDILALISLTRDTDGRVSGSVGVNRDITELSEAQRLAEATQSLLQQALDAAPHAFNVKDLEGRFSFVNRALGCFYGLEPEAMLGYNVSELGLAHDELTPFRELDTRVVRTGRPVVDEEVRVINPVTGITEWYQTTKVPLFAPEGEMNAILTVTTNVSEKKRAEEALRTSEARYRAVVEDQTEFILRLKLDGTVLFVNDAYALALGRSSVALVGLNLFDLLPETLRAEVAAQHRRLESQEHVSTLVERTMSDGTKRWHEWSSRGIFVEGRLREIQAVGRDVTERKRADTALRQSESRLREAQALGRIGHYEFDLVSAEVTWSEEMFRIHGLEPSEHLPSFYKTLVDLGEDGERTVRPEATYLELVHSEDRERFRSVLERFATLGQSVSLEYRIVVPDVGVRTVHSQGRLQTDASGRSQRFVGVVQDISERKAAERELRELSAQLIRSQETERRRIARELHDDIGQSLTAIKVAHLSSAGAPAAVRAGLDDVLAKVRRLSLSLHPSTLEDLGLLAALRWHVLQFAEGAGLRVSFHTNLDDAKNADEARDDPLPEALQMTVYRIAQEALTNVIRHADATRVEVSLLRDAEMLELRLRDDGVGFRLGAGTPRSLGLRSMRERTRLLGGTLDLSAEPGQGTQVLARFPLTPVEA